jgi:hypothetical protein
MHLDPPFFSPVELVPAPLRSCAPRCTCRPSGWALAAVRAAAGPQPPVEVTVPEHLLHQPCIEQYPLFRRSPEEQARWDAVMAEMDEYVSRVSVAEHQAVYQRYVDMAMDWFAEATREDSDLDTPADGG